MKTFFYYPIEKVQFWPSQLIIVVRLRFDQGYLVVADLIVIRIRRNMLRPTLRPSAESFVQNQLDVALIDKGSNTDIWELTAQWSSNSLSWKILGASSDAAIQYIRPLVYRLYMNQSAPLGTDYTYGRNPFPPRTPS